MKQANNPLHMLLKLCFLAACFLVTTSLLPFHRLWQIDQLKHFNEWFQINWQGQVVGWSNFSIERQPKYFLVTHEEHFEGRVRGKRMHFAYRYDWKFSNQAPYELLEGKAVQKEPALTMTTEFTNAEQLTITQQRNQRQNTFIEEPIDFRLSQLLSVREFIESRPSKGDTVQFQTLDPHSLELNKSTLSVLAVPSKRHQRYLLANQGAQSELSGISFGLSGKVLKQSRGRGIELIASNKKPSFNPEMQRDLYASNGLMVTQPLGELGQLEQLTISLVSGTMDELDVHPSAQLNHQLDQQQVITHKAPTYPARSGEAENWQFSHPNNTVSALMPNIKQNQSPLSTVKQLLTFTHNYLYYKATPTSFSIEEVIENGYGDCTEYTQLMLALLNVANIPARSVEGYIYLGDQEQQFGGHEWVEVLIDGEWRGVDPTWNMMNTTAGHLPITLSKGISASDLVFTVEEIHYN